MTEIDAKAKMKERMAKMRAKKGAKAAPALKPKKKINLDKLHNAVIEADRNIDDGDHDGHTNVVEVVIPELKPKFWIVKDLADACMIPETEVQYLVYFLNAAIIQAIRTKKSIAHIVWYENRTFEIVHVGDAPTPAAKEDAFA